MLIGHFCDRLSSIQSFAYAWFSQPSTFSGIFIKILDKGNALLRIGDVLRFSPVAVDVGAGFSTLSYQKGYFPVLEVLCRKLESLPSSNSPASQFLSSDLVLKTTMHQNTK